MPKKKEIRLDMHPFADLAFLLVTFFLLATVMKSYKPVSINKPTSHAEQKLEDKNMMTISISEEGNIYFGITGQQNRKSLLAEIQSDYDIDLSQPAADNFSLTSSFGVQIEQLNEFFQKDRRERQDLEQPGIRMDSISNELEYLVKEAKVVNPDYNIAIEADAEVPYGKVRKVVDMLVENNYTKLNLVTDLKNPEE